MSGIFTETGAYRPVDERTCVRCHHVLVDEDGEGRYYQVPTQHNMGPLIPGEPDTILTFSDRVHECGGEAHLLPGELVPRLGSDEAR
jgi:hypothetical protein